jgi:pimeloyl-ACP methyl ester carboxylesterase
MVFMEHRTLNGKGGNVHYWVKGRGADCIAFTHGATMDHGMFDEQVNFFSSQYKVITWDVPAHGSSRPYQDFSLQNSADELIRILDQEDAEKAHLVGQSMGGYIIQIAALTYPDRVLTLTALGSSPIQPSYYSAMDNWLLSITPSLLMLYPYNFLIKTIATQIALRQSAQAYAMETLKMLTKREIADIMEKVYKGLQEYKEDFRLPLPILIAYGDSDRSGKVQEYCNRWAERENRDLKIIPNAAHNANMDNPKAFTQTLQDFINEWNMQ